MEASAPGIAASGYDHSAALWREGANISPMKDPFGRTVDYLRVSVTDRCDFRCVYCMSEDMTFLPKQELLTLEEMDRLCSAFIAKGPQPRLTGGEPLVRKNIMWLIERLGRHLKTGALDELTLTTNGSQLSRFADDLHALVSAGSTYHWIRPNCRNSPTSPAGDAAAGARRPAGRQERRAGDQDQHRRAQRHQR